MDAENKKEAIQATEKLLKEIMKYSTGSYPINLRVATDKCKAQHDIIYVIHGQSPHG